MLSQAKKIVIKVGTSSLTYENGKLNLRRVDALCRVIADLMNSGMDVALVSSGAIGVGTGKLGLLERPSDTPSRQAVAAVGQCELMFMYDKFFGEYSKAVAQVLLTADVTADAQRRLNVQNTFQKLLEIGVLPIINENDTVETLELEGEHFGDNDILSATVAEIIEADALIIFTDIDGLYDRDPKKYPEARLIHTVERITDELEAAAGGAGSLRGTGGMATKVRAAKKAVTAGIDCVVINGSRPGDIYKLLAGEEIGTVFLAAKA